MCKRFGLKKIIRILGNFLSVLSIGFVMVALFKLDINPKSIMGNRTTMFLMGGGIVFGTVWVFILGYAWKRSLEVLSDRSLDITQVMRIFSKTNIGKYLPGNVMQYVERNLFADSIGANQINILLSSALEITGVVLASLLLAVIFGWESCVDTLSYIHTNYPYLILIAVVLLLVIFIIMLFGREKFYICKKSFFNKRFIWIFLSNVAIYLVGFLLLSVLFVLFVYGHLEIVIEYQDVKLLIAAYAISYLCGFVMPGVPGGIGVREFMLLTLVTGTEYQAVVLLAAVEHRLITLIGDICAYVIAGKMK